MGRSISRDRRSVRIRLAPGGAGRKAVAVVIARPLAAAEGLDPGVNQAFLVAAVCIGGRDGLAIVTAIPEVPVHEGPAIEAGVHLEQTLELAARVHMAA